MLTTQGPQRKLKSERVDRTIENNFLILKIEKRNKLIVFDLFLSNPKQNKTSYDQMFQTKTQLYFTVTLSNL